MKNEDILCLLDSATTHTILKDRKFFHTLTKKRGSVTTISNDNVLIVGSRRASLILPMGTEPIINNALLYPQSTRTLLSFKDIRLNGFHIETETENDVEYLLMTQSIGCRKQIVKKLPSFPLGLYYTYIRPSHHNVAMSLKFKGPYSFKLWHERLGHLRHNMMCRILTNSIGHNMPCSKIPSVNKFICEACAKGKIIVQLVRKLE